MKAIILHESKGRIRFRIGQKKMTLQEADVLENWFQKKSWITQVTVHERTGCVILQYSGSRKEVLAAIREFNLQEAQSQITLPLHSSRELNRKFQEKLVGKVVLKAASMLFLPKPLQIARIVWHMLPFLKRGIHCLWRGKLKVDVLDALSIGISAFRKDFGTAGTVMFLLELGELLEEWTRKKSMEDLARCMALNVDRVWLKTPESEILTAVSDIRPGDKIVIRTGSMIPMDGILSLLHRLRRMPFEHWQQGFLMNLWIGWLNRKAGCISKKYLPDAETSMAGIFVITSVMAVTIFRSLFTGNKSKITITFPWQTVVLKIRVKSS